MIKSAICTLLFLSTTALAMQSIRVEAVEGSVHAWLPNADHWRMVRGISIIPVDTIILTEKDASVQLTFQTFKSGKWVKKDSLTVSIPTVFRANWQTIRKYREEQRELTLNGNEVNDTRAEPQEFEDAWQRLDLKLLVKNIKEIIDSLRTGEKLDSEFKLKSASSQIKLFTPIHNSRIRSSHVIHRLPVSWSNQKMKQGEHYSVYVWKDGENKKLYKETDSNIEWINLQVPGTYMVKVETKDGFWKSAIHKVRISENIPNSSDMEAGNSRKNTLQVQYPGADFVAILDVVEDIQFSWEIWPKTKYYQLEFFDDTGKLIQSLKTSENKVKLSLMAGSYRWNIEAHGVHDELMQTSISNRLQIIVKPKKTILRDILHSNFKGRIYLNSTVSAMSL